MAHEPWMIPWPASRLLTTPGQRLLLEATDGGQGSFSYADTSVYGQRKPRSQFYSPYITLQVPGDWLHRTVTLIPTPHLIVPGSGGGARLPGGRKYGSKALGFDPRGAVLLRLYR